MIIEEQEIESNDEWEMDDAIPSKKVLVVGAGGIGCELLKCLVMSNFKKITIVDLDKVEKSNLNRQFLFDKDSIGKYKSEMAKVAIEKIRQDEELEITAYVGNIKDADKFNKCFFQQFDVVLNALDNIEARSYINKICLIMKIPMVNSGTEGYLGNVSNHIRDLTSCYDCREKNVEITIPICTIRSVPVKIEHCVAWAKMLFEHMYCEKTNGNELLDYRLSEDNIENFNNFFYNIDLEQKANENKVLHPININEIYNKIINEKLTIVDYYEFNENVHQYDNDKNIDTGTLIIILIKSADSLKSMPKFEKFDKENKDIVNFVFAASNLRAKNFSISLESRFKVKEIAGKIVPAIASTNAVIAAIQTVEAVKVVLNKKDTLRNTEYTRRKKIASSLSQDEIKYERCPMCSIQKTKLSLELNYDKFTLENLVKMCRDKLKFNTPEIYHNDNLLYECGDDLKEEEIKKYDLFLPKKIRLFKISDFSSTWITDPDDDKILNFILSHNDKLSEEDYILDEKFEEFYNNYDSIKTLSANNVVEEKIKDYRIDDDNAILIETNEDDDLQVIEDVKNKKVESVLAPVALTKLYEDKKDIDIFLKRKRNAVDEIPTLSEKQQKID